MFISSDDADVGEIKKNQKPVRRGRKQAASNKSELDPGWQEPRDSVSSHSSGDEGEEPVHTSPAPPASLMDVHEGEADPKTGNTCNALSGDRTYFKFKTGQIIEIIMKLNCI